MSVLKWNDDATSISALSPPDIGVPNAVSHELLCRRLPKRAAGCFRMARHSAGIDRTLPTPAESRPRSRFISGRLYEWDARKAAANLKKIEYTSRKRDPCSLTRLQGRTRTRIIGARLATSDNSMKKELPAKSRDELRQEDDLSRLQGGVRGKYYSRANAGTNLVLIEPDFASLFPDSDTVNRALRVLADAAQAATSTKRRRPRAS